jgi:hypothetical protein
MPASYTQSGPLDLKIPITVFFWILGAGTSAPARLLMPIEEKIAAKLFDISVESISIVHHNRDG